MKVAEVKIVYSLENGSVVSRQSTEANKNPNAYIEAYCAYLWDTVISKKLEVCSQICS